MTNNKTQQLEQVGVPAKGLQKSSLQSKAGQAQTQPEQIGAKEAKPAYQTYIYRSYGGGYQGL